MNEDLETRRKSKRFGWLGKGVIGIFLGGMIFSALFFIGFDVVANSTKSNEFCTSCHTMHSNFSEYQGTAHFQNRVGIQASCSSCHVPASGIGLLWAKIHASKDVYHEFMGTISTDEKFESQRARMAQIVWDKMEANDSRECRSCHEFSSMDLLAQKPGARKYHEVAIKDGVTCISCHKGIAHFLPAAGGDDPGASKLREAAKAVPSEAKQLYAIETVPFYVSSGKERDPTNGKLMPSAMVEKLGEDGDLIKVRIGGWRQEGVDKLAYHAAGKRILNAVFSQEVADKMTKGKTITDEETGQKWTEVSTEAWIEKGKLVDKPQLIWDTGKQLMTANCGNCHAETDPTHFTANQWIGVIQSMQIRTSMNDEQKRLLMQFAQKHGSDMGSGEGR